MSNITQVNLKSLKNAAHAEFHENVKKSIEKTGAIVLGIEDLFIFYTNHYNNELEALKFMKKSELTAQISEQDAVRDAVFRGLWDTIKGARNHFSAEYRNAANKLWEVLSHYGNLGKLPLDQQSALVSDICRKFQEPELDNAIVLLHLHEWTRQLEDENEKLRNLMQERYNEPVGKTAFRMKTTRVEVDKYYRLIVKQLECKLAVGNNSTAFNEFIIELNAIIKRFKNILAQEFGRKNANANPSPKGKIVEIEKLEDGKFKIKRS